MKKSVVFAICAVLLLAISASSLANVREIVYNGDYQLTEADQNWLSRQNWLWRSADDMVKDLPSHLMYHTLSIEKPAPFKVAIYAEARQPFIAIKSGGYYVLIDMYGVVLDLSDEATAPYSIEGFHVTSAVVGKPLVAEQMQLIERAVQIVYMFKTHTDYQPNIFLKDDHIMQKMTDDIYIDFGQGDDVELQFNSAMVAYQNMIERSGSSGVVNVSNPNQCIVEPLKR